MTAHKWIRDCAIVLSVSVSLYGALWFFEAEQQQHAIDRLKHGLTVVQQDLQNEISRIVQSARGIAQAQAVQEFYLGEETSADGAATLALRHLLYTDPLLFQARIIDDTGHERVRVERGFNDEVITIAQSALQDKGHREYVQRGLSLPFEELDFSVISLNREFQQITLPYTPTVRLMLHLKSPGKQSTKPSGPGFKIQSENSFLLVINLKISALLSRMQHNAESILPNLNALSSRGGWLLHSDQGALYGDELRDRPNMQQVDPDMWQRIQNMREDQFVRYRGWLLKSTRLSQQQRIPEKIILLVPVDPRTAALSPFAYLIWAATSLLISILLCGYFRQRETSRVNADSLSLAQRELAAKLESQQRIQQRIIDNISLGIAYFNASGTCLFTNARLHKIVPGLSQRISDVNIQSIVGSKYFKRYQADIDGTSTGKPFEYIRQFSDIDGRTTFYQINLIPIRLASGDNFNLLVTMEDISATRLASDELEINKQALKQETVQAKNAARSKANFIAHVSHEIRTPLNGITGVAQLFNLTDLSDEQRKYIKIISESANKLMRLLNDLMDLSRLEVDALKLDSTDFNLEQLFASVAKQYSSGAEDKNLELIVHIDPSMPVWFRGDGYRLEQVMSNLVSNGLKYTERGWIKMSVKELAQDREFRTLSLSVSDSGIGLNNEQLNQLFHSPNDDMPNLPADTHGAALGLMVSQQIISKMGGNMHVSSSQDNGTHIEVVISLPLAKQSTTIADWQLQLKHILLVDDNEEALLIVSRYLRHWGVEVDTADSAKLGLSMMERALVKENPYDVVITDYKMPETDGLMFIDQIQSQFTSQNIPFLVIMTSYQHTLLQEKAEQIEHLTILAKPVNASELFNLLSNLSQGLTTQPAITFTDDVVLSRSLAGLEILLAEDNPTSQLIEKTALEELGAKVTTTANAEGAIEAATMHLYDCILMDYHMPDLDGHLATKILRERGVRTPVIILTAACFDEDRRLFERAGVDAFLIKPFDSADLQVKILHLLEAGETQLP